MKIAAEVLRKIQNHAQLKEALKVAQCTEVEKAEICQFILKESALFQFLTPYIYGLNSFLEIFSDKNTAVGMEEKIFQALTNDEQGFTRFFDSPYGFECVIRAFVRTDLSQDAQLRRFLELLNHFSISSAFKSMTHYKNFLVELIRKNPDRQDQIIAWAKQNQLIPSDQYINELLDGVTEAVKRIEEAQRNAVLEAQLKEIRFKVSVRRSPSGRTQLHDLVSQLDPRDADYAEVIVLRKSGALLEAQDQYGETPLISAAIKGNRIMTLLLLSFGAKAAVTDLDGYTPKLFKLFYSCDDDDDYDEDACIPLKRHMDHPFRDLLEKIEALEVSQLSQETKLYSLETIKADLLSIIQDYEFQDAKLIVALCGYIFNNVADHEREAVCQFFKKNCKQDITREAYLSESFTGIAITAEAAVPAHQNIAALAVYRTQLHGPRDRMLVGLVDLQRSALDQMFSGIKK